MTQIISQEPSSPLRVRMLEDMRLRQLGRACQTNYVRAAKKFAAFLGRSPETATAEDIRRFQLSFETDRADAHGRQMPQKHDGHQEPSNSNRSEIHCAFSSAFGFDESFGELEVDRNKVLSFAVFVGAVTSAMLVSVPTVTAAENGKGIYLLGSKNSMAGVVPPAGFYFTSETYFYSGEAGGSLEIEGAGRIVSGVQADVVLEVPIGLWVVPQQVAGGNLGFGVLTPFGHADVSAAAEVAITGGPTIGTGVGDSSFTFGDPVFLATLGWSHEQLFWSVYSLLNVPIGNYKNGRLSNLAFNRWALDLGASATWFDALLGYELSSTVGFTFNGENPSTDYKTGTEFHVEFAAMKHFNPSFALGFTGYHYKQISNDSGAGASLGGFRGQTTGLGGIISLNVKAGSTPVNIKGRFYQELDTKNRLEATTGFITVAFPL